MRKVKTNYSELTQSEFDDFLTHLTNCLTGNANFPHLPEALADITQMQSDWMKEISKSRLGDHQATQKAKDLRNELASKVKKNGNYINDTADGKVDMLESSGYTLAKEAEYPNKPDIKVVQGEKSGSGTMVIEAIKGAVTYLVEIAPDPKPAPGNDSTWKRLPMSTKCSIPVSGLEPRKLYWVKFCYVTVDGEADYCEPRSFSVV
jgi:hypothetical protein